MHYIRIRLIAYATPSLELRAHLIYFFNFGLWKKIHSFMCYTRSLLSPSLSCRPNVCLSYYRWRCDRIPALLHSHNVKVISQVISSSWLRSGLINQNRRDWKEVITFYFISFKYVRGSRQAADGG